MTRNISLVFICLFLFCGDPKKEFIALLRQSDLTFFHPMDFTISKVYENPDVLYQYALKHNQKKLEIRFSLWPLKEQLEEYRNKKDSRVISTNPNELYKIFTLTILMNISGTEQILNSVEYKPAAVKKEFNADWGASYHVECASEFCRDYKNALVVALHKDDAADAYIIYLFDHAEDVSKEILNSFYSLKFN